MVREKMPDEKAKEQENANASSPMKIETAPIDQNNKDEKKKPDKMDKTIEKLKSKPPEEIKKEIKKDFKSQVIKYKTLSIIVSAILFLVLFAIAVAASYYANLTPPPETDYRPEAKVELPSQTPTEEIDTSGWETYKNEGYGFSFKYPRDEYTSCDYSTTASGIQLWTKPWDCQPAVDSWYEISVFRFDKEEYQSDTEAVSEEGVTISGYTAVKKIYDLSSLENDRLKPLENEIEYLVDRGKDYIHIVFFGKEGDRIEIFEQVVNSLEFSDSQVQGISISSITCVNENQDILSEVSQCETLTDKSCLEHVDQFDYCMSSCLNILDETKCTDICRPVCETDTPDEL